MKLIQRFVSLTLRQRHFRSLLGFILILFGLVFGFSLVFQTLMALEGQHHSWISAFYWTLTTMSTLGYGDITFSSDSGRLFSIIVLFSGMIFLLVVLPFTFINLFYEPWMRSRAASLVPRSVAADLQGHVILTFYDAVASALIEKLKNFNYPYVVILPDFEQVALLREKGIQSILGELNDPETYRCARVERAIMVATTCSDIVNTSVAFTVTGITDKTRVIATAREKASIEILKMAGCNRVLDLSRLMAEALARRARGGNQFSHVVGQIDDLLIAEVVASRTTLVGRNYLDAQKETSVSIVGFWVRGDFQVGQPDSIIEANSVLVMAGSRQKLNEFDTHHQASTEKNPSKPVIIIGGGRVGRATAAALQRRGIEYRIVEQLSERIGEAEHYVLGSGADKSVLLRAGIEETPTVIITTRDDETNIYLTIFCRLLRPDIQIISRSTLERNVAALHRAGSDIVMSYASMGSNAFFNLLQRSDLLMIAEGLDVFKVPVPKELAGKSLAEANLRQRTQCSIIGIDSEDETRINPSPESLLPTDGEIVLIGTPAAEAEYLKLFPGD
ncbi:MAG: voltage-gated potassium channel [Gammaproteobacteria bacterium]|jgi:voltage-gated potassium channel